MIIHNINKREVKIITKSTYIKSPLNYVGGKFKLLPQILPLFPDNINTFIDLFGGGFNVGINVEANKIIYNDVIPQVVDLFRNFSLLDSTTVHEKVLEVINKYGLSRSDMYGYEFYGCNSNDGLGNYNKEKYIKMREDYNNNPNWLLFYTLITCSFSNQIRFNSKGGFNMPYGKRDYNSSLQEKLKVFINELHEKNIEFYNEDFYLVLNKIQLNIDDLIYCDPPYLDSTATYNENGGWGLKQEEFLRSLLDEVNSKNIKFALSNNLSSNDTLKDWAEINGYNIHYLNHTYSNCNYQKKDKDKSDLEVLITNY